MNSPIPLSTLPVLFLGALTGSTVTVSPLGAMEGDAIVAAQRSAPEPIEVRWRVEPVRPFVGQAFEAVLEIDLDAAWAEESLVQLFPQELDVPLDVDAFPKGDIGSLTWIRSEVSGAAEEDLASRTLVEGDERVRALASRPSAEILRLTLRRAARFERARPAELPAVSVTYSASSRFIEGVVGGRVAVDPKVATVEGESLEIVPRSQPEEGRPPEFRGAVGTFELSWSLPPATVRAQEPFKVQATLEGGARLAKGVLPSPVAGSGENVGSLGMRRSTIPGTDSASLVFDFVASSSGPVRLPVIAFTAFDPVDERYVQHSTDPIELLAIPAQESRGESAVHPPADLVDEASVEDVADTEKGGLGWTIGMLLFVLLIALASVLRRNGMISAPGEAEGGGTP